jgi:hypothetical protein
MNKILVCGIHRQTLLQSWLAVFVVEQYQLQGCFPPLPHPKFPLASHIYP